MEAGSQIVAGGGWKETRIERVKVKAWTALFGAIGLASISALAADSIWYYVYLPAGVVLLISVILFFRERPREIQFPSGSAKEDLRKLYGASARARQTAKGRASEDQPIDPRNCP